MFKFISKINVPIEIPKNVVFDLDNTLIYSSEEPPDGNHIKIMFRSCDDYEDIILYMTLRPGIKDLFKNLKKLDYNVGIWSAGKPLYIKEVCKNLPICYVENEILIGDKNDLKVEFIKTWNDCYRKNYKVYKPLIKTCFGSASLIVEDNIECCDEGDNHIIVLPYTGEKNDTCLYEVKKFLC